MRKRRRRKRKMKNRNMWGKACLGGGEPGTQMMRDGICKMNGSRAKLLRKKKKGGKIAGIFRVADREEEVEEMMVRERGNKKAG